VTSANCRGLFKQITIFLLGALLGAAVFLLVSATFDLFKPFCAGLQPLTTRPATTATTISATTVATTTEALADEEALRRGPPPSYHASTVIEDFGEQFWDRARRNADSDEDWFCKCSSFLIIILKYF